MIKKFSCLMKNYMIKESKKNPENFEHYLFIFRDSFKINNLPDLVFYKCFWDMLGFIINTTFKGKINNECN